jgi:hypothetical protein
MPKYEYYSRSVFFISKENERKMENEREKIMLKELFIYFIKTWIVKLKQRRQLSIIKFHQLFSNIQKTVPFSYLKKKNTHILYIVEKVNIEKNKKTKI